MTDHDDGCLSGEPRYCVDCGTRHNGPVHVSDCVECGGRLVTEDEHPRLDSDDGGECQAAADGQTRTALGTMRDVAHSRHGELESAASMVGADEMAVEASTEDEPPRVRVRFAARELADALSRASDAAARLDAHSGTRDVNVRTDGRGRHGEEREAWLEFDLGRPDGPPPHYEAHDRLHCQQEKASFGWQTGRVECPHCGEEFHVLAPDVVDGDG